MAPAAGGYTGVLKWAVLGGLILVLVAVLVWAGTQQRAAHAQTADDATSAASGSDAGALYLAKNKGKPGVTTTASGLQYEVLTAGTGAQPTAADTVKVHYEGRLLDGTVFDSSYKRGEPATFPLNGVIAGWTEGVQLMKTGAKYRFTIPSALAYGDSGAGGVIPPNAVLVFDIELLGVAGK